MFSLLCSVSSLGRLARRLFLPTLCCFSSRYIVQNISKCHVRFVRIFQKLSKFRLATRCRYTKWVKKWQKYHAKKLFQMLETILSQNTWNTFLHVVSQLFHWSKCHYSNWLFKMTWIRGSLKKLELFNFMTILNLVLFFRQPRKRC